MSKILCTAMAVFIWITSCDTSAQNGSKATLGEKAWQESALPIRLGEPGKTPFWNEYAKRFIYAPAFNFKAVENAINYRYEIRSLQDSNFYSFERNVPYAPLSPVWAEIPVGQYELQVIGLSSESDQLEAAGKRQFYRASPFDPVDGVYHEPVMPYDRSAMLALTKLMHKDYVSYWLNHNLPDPDYRNYKFPAKIYSALIVGAVTYAKLKPSTKEAKRAIQIATTVADYLIDISFEEGILWEFFPPTYHWERFDENPIPHKPHMRGSTVFSIMGADAGHAYLDLYDYTGNEKYFEAAQRIAETYRSTQLDSGSWHMMVHYKTGEPLAPIISIPTAVINYFDRLKEDYGVDGFEKSTEKAMNWIMNNPVKTFNWQGQFEDIKLRPPYRNQSREQACDLASYLFKSDKNIELAEELVRFAEDQFVIWENPRDITIGRESQSRGGYSSKNWITPSVQEQYVFWMPVGRSAGIMIDTYLHAYEATQKEIYLAKAKSIANALTLVQKAHEGTYPTFFTEYPMNRWLNSAVYPARIMIKLENSLNDH